MEKSDKTLFVFLSFANSWKTRNYTLDAILSLIHSTVDWNSKFGICVVETNNNEQWGCLKPFVHVVHPNKKFNYNEFANIGISDFILNKPDFDFGHICLCNNDLYFHKGFYEHLIKLSNVYGFDSLSPKCGLSNSNIYLSHLTNSHEFVEGYQTARQLNGWCLFLKRETHDLIGGFDEDFSFWCADDSYREQLLSKGLKHAVSVHARVDHLDDGSNTINSLNDSSLNQEFTRGNLDKYRKKFNRT